MTASNLVAMHATGGAAWPPQGKIGTAARTSGNFESRYVGRVWGADGRSSCSQASQSSRLDRALGDAEVTGPAMQAPPISLPKGGGAIRGIGEKFAANPVTGTGSLTVPIATSPGRSGFGPQLSLSYDSGPGNGPFGFGWNLSLPSITRKTDKGLPRYDDAGVRRLHPVRRRRSRARPDGERRAAWRHVETAHAERRRLHGPALPPAHRRTVRAHRALDAASAIRDDVFWRSISRDNITTWYGKTPRAASPIPPTRPASSAG